MRTVCELDPKPATQFLQANLNLLIDLGRDMDRAKQLAQQVELPDAGEVRDNRCVGDDAHGFASK